MTTNPYNLGYGAGFVEAKVSKLSVPSGKSHEFFWVRTGVPADGNARDGGGSEATTPDVEG